MKTITTVILPGFSNNLVRWSCFIVICLYVWVASSAIAATNAENQDSQQTTALEKGRLYTEWFYTGELDLLYEQLLFDFTMEELIAYRDTFLTQLG